MTVEPCRDGGPRMEVKDGWGKQERNLKYRVGDRMHHLFFRAGRICLQSFVFFWYLFFVMIQRKEWGRNLPGKFRIPNETFQVHGSKSPCSEKKRITPSTRAINSQQ